MKRFFLALLGCLFAGLAQAGGIHSGGPAQTHLGQIATRSNPGSVFSSSGVDTDIQTRSGHIFPNGANSFQLGFQGWIGNGSDLPIGSNDTLNSVEVEYPLGTCTQVTFSGSNTGTIISGTLQYLSDTININIPAGATAWIYVNRTNTTRLVYGGNTVNTNMRDAVAVSGSAISHTPCQAPPNLGTSGTLTLSVPMIVGQTTRPSLCIIGDSIGAGSADAINATGDIGYIARSIGPRFGYINLSISGTTTTTFNTNVSKRVPLVQTYCTHVISEIGVNNFITGDTAAQVETGLQAVWAAGWCTPPLKCYQTTITPVTCSSDSWATTVNQSAAPCGAYTFTEADRQTVNTYIATVPSPLTGSFDPNTVMSTSNKWCAPGCTTDGIHPQPAPTLSAVAVPVIPYTTFTYPP